MQKIFMIILVFFMGIIPAYSAVVEGGVSKTGEVNRIVDSDTNLPVSGAKVSLPKQNYTTYTDENGIFNLRANVKDASILAVEKEGYKPFSLTVNERMAARPIVLGIEKSNAQDIIISSEMFHLGDDNFSEASANSNEFKGRAIGPFYSKTFMMAANAISRKNYLVIGSIIGIDTLMARTMRQNSIVNSFASPPEIYFNGTKIAEIQLNGDGQRVRLPNNLIRSGQMNEITIRTGRNLRQTAYVDYDDIEFMNLSIEAD